MKRNVLRGLLGLAALAAFTLGPVTAMADSSASVLPPQWHIHDGQLGLGSQHKGIGFFPTILGISTATYLEDPATCMECHNQHYTEWSGSMHAYASDDPVFVAMNNRGQRETGNQLGTFCVQCHAPVAVRDRVCARVNLGEVVAHRLGRRRRRLGDRPQVVDGTPHDGDYTRLRRAPARGGAPTAGTSR